MVVLQSQILELEVEKALQPLQLAGIFQVKRRKLQRFARQKFVYLVDAI